MNPKTTALMILDGQNDFLNEGGVLYEAVKSTTNGKNLMDKLNSAIDIARGSGVQVINTLITFSEGYPEVGENPYGIFAAVGQTGGFIKGTWGAESAERLDIRNDDLVLEKHGMSAFLNPGLEGILRDRGIKTLVLAGLLTDACVECTMRSAYDKGFEVYSLTDVTAALDSDKHKATVEGSYPMFSKALTTDGFKEELKKK